MLKSGHYGVGFYSECYDRYTFSTLSNHERSFWLGLLELEVALEYEVLSDPYFRKRRLNQTELYLFF